MPFGTRAWGAPLSIPDYFLKTYLNRLVPVLRKNSVYVFFIQAFCGLSSCNFGKLRICLFSKKQRIAKKCISFLYDLAFQDCFGNVLFFKKVINIRQL